MIQNRSANKSNITSRMDLVKRKLRLFLIRAKNRTDLLENGLNRRKRLLLPIRFTTKATDSAPVLPIRLPSRRIARHLALVQRNHQPTLRHPVLEQSRLHRRTSRHLVSEVDRLRHLVTNLHPALDRLNRLHRREVHLLHGRHQVPVALVRSNNSRSIKKIKC